jgi:hypothetical protein
VGIFIQKVRALAKINEIPIKVGLFVPIFDHLQWREKASTQEKHVDGQALPILLGSGQTLQPASLRHEHMHWQSFTQPAMARPGMLQLLLFSWSDSHALHPTHSPGQ